MNEKDVETPSADVLKQSTKVVNQQVQVLSDILTALTGIKASQGIAQQAHRTTLESIFHVLEEIKESQDKTAWWLGVLLIPTSVTAAAAVFLVINAIMKG
jgi:hypothetical protein